MDSENKNNKQEVKTIELQMAPPSKFSIFLVLALTAAVAVFLVWGIWEAANPPKPPIQGQMDARTLSVSSKVPGRVFKVLVKEGDNVKAGDPVAELSLPELEAKLGQVKAQEAAAQAKQKLVDEGARPQEKEAAKALMDQALAGATLAEQTFKRISALYKQGFVSAQKYDEVKAQYDAAQQQYAAARSQYEIAEIGAREQEKQAVADLKKQAEEGVKEVQSYLDNRILKAPSAGQIDRIILVDGEIAPAGFPVATIVDLTDQWGAFNFREDQMPGITIGSYLVGTVPALGGKRVKFKVYYISPKASYATWRSTRQDSGYDMKTFEVRGRPVTSIEDLRPGMSILIPDE